MLAEALVLFSCLNNTGCSDTSNLYFGQNPEVRQMIDKNLSQARDFVGPKVVDTVGPFLFLAAGGVGVIKLNKSFSVNGNRTGATLIFGFDL